MSSRIVGLALVLVCLPVAGCGTAANLVHTRPESGGTTPFGGVRHDLAFIRDAATDDRHEQHLESHPRTVMMFLCAADLPFSFVGDIVTWPYTATYTYINRPATSPPVLTVPTLMQSTLIPPDQMPKPAISIPDVSDRKKEP